MALMLSMYLCCFGAIIYLFEYDGQSEACFAEADYPECWVMDPELEKMIVSWDTVIEFGKGCDHCFGELHNCTHDARGGSEAMAPVVTVVDRLGDCVATNETAGPAFPCDPTQPHYTDSVCRTCGDVEWPGKEPSRCAVRGFTSIPTAAYFVVATMTTVGYGEHYPTSVYGKLVCSVTMLCGIAVLALPMVILGQSIEETVREEGRMATERERRLKVILLERNFADTVAVNKRVPSAKSQDFEMKEQIEADIARLDREKAIREQYDIETARRLMIHLVEELAISTDDGRFDAAAEILRKPQDYYA